jgi:ribosome biogenesis GTPase
MDDIAPETLGWDEFFASQDPNALATDTARAARVFRQDREAFDALDLEGREVRARLGGGLSYRAGDKRELPSVGDWVVVKGEPGELSTVVEVFDRKSCLVRQAPSKATEPQVIAANVDTVFVVTTPNEEFSARRLERYLFAIRDGGAEPVIVLNKVDLVDDPTDWIARAEDAASSTSVVTTSAVDGDVGALDAWLGEGQTVALVGSSGVGKSTLINCLLGQDRQKTGDIREDDASGRHTTVTRELFVMPDQRGLLIDTPGLRELQLWAGESEAEEAFDDIEELAMYCKFRDCKHETEPGCAVRDAVEAGELAAERLAAWRKLQTELDSQRERQDESARRSSSGKPRRRPDESD